MNEFKEKFYKYAPMCRSSEQDIDNLVQQKVWIPPVRELNDPSEGHFILKAPPSGILSCNRLFKIFHNAAKEAEPKLTEKQFQEQLANKEFNDCLNSPYVQNNFHKEYVNETFKNHGVFSLTGEGASNKGQMWENYACNHQGYRITFELDFGLCFKDYMAQQNASFLPEFDKNGHYEECISKIMAGNEMLPFFLSSEKSERRFAFTRIKYQRDKGVVNICKLEKLLQQYGENSYKHQKYFIQNTIAVKEPKWSYEHEYRLVVNSNSEDIGTMLPLRIYAPFLKIVGITLGV